MMRCIVTYHDLAKKAIIESSGDHKITFNIIYNQTRPLFIKLSQMKFEVKEKELKLLFCIKINTLEPQAKQGRIPQVFRKIQRRDRNCV